MYFFILLKVIVSKRNSLAQNEIKNNNENSFLEYDIDDSKNNENIPSKGLYDNFNSDYNDIKDLHCDYKNNNENISSTDYKKNILDDNYFSLPEYIEDFKNNSKDNLDLTDATRDKIFQLDDKKDDFEDISKRISDLSIEASKISSDMNKRRTKK